MSNNNNEIVDKLIETKNKLCFSDSFLEQMSRNVRGPLYSIIEFSKLAIGSMSDEVAVHHYLDQINRAGHFMNESMDDVMAMRQIIMQNVSIHPESINVDKLVEALENDLSHIFSYSGILFKPKTIDLKDCVIIADYSILFQILRKMIRLVSNLLPAKSTLDFEVYKSSESYNEYEIGFKVYSSEAILTSSQVDALRLGYNNVEKDMYNSIDSMDPMIFILRCYAHEMGTDTVNVKNDAEKGVEIDLKLRFPIVTGEQLELLSNRNYDFSQKRILVADDDEINLEIIEKLLREKGAEVITVRDGREALLTYRTEHGKFDLILLDIVMPDIDGLAVARMIRDNTTIPSSKNVPIIAMTVNAFHEDYEQSLKAGMNSHLVKPIDSERLYNTLAEYI
ncbi:response regulator [Butyrivibrio sp. AE3004]|uniref:response regulator n=1 Tax=Butyrivibrio sp. AE3004 TaxID=1506994 RepID=UPI000494C695|nr:response regulator [Butyrivibrio sp. AE3004]